MLKPIVFLLMTYTLSVQGHFLTNVEFKDGVVKANAYRKSTEHGNIQVLCEAAYHNQYHKTGWNVFEAQSNPSIQTDAEQAECIGNLEGMVTKDDIYIHYYNNVKKWCNKQKKTCAKVYDFLDNHLKWVGQKIAVKGDTDPIWHQVDVFYKQIFGLYKGYQATLDDPKKNLTINDFVVMNLQADLEDVVSALEGDVSSKLKGNTRCSAIVKLLPGNTDLLVGHNTWTEYSQMYRTLKKYNMTVRKTGSSDLWAPTQMISFSGYPGMITSQDDFYTTSSGLVVTETTIGNSNASRWQYVKPTGQLFESVRSMVALRLAKNGLSWSKIFKQYNSGTYNNQWIIVDLKRFKKGMQPRPGTLWILEQIPGYVRHEDQTSRLIYQGYWPSYNVPFYTDVFNLSGNQELVQKYGDWFSYDKTARALIFQRNQSSITDVGSLLRLLQYNDYTNDPYSKCNCTPPYSAENALAARSDLNPENGQYPFPALGHRPHGAIDAKVTSSLLASKLMFTAICGPTKGTNLPLFQWSKSDFNHLPHMGQPDSFNFDPVTWKWEGPFF